MKLSLLKKKLGELHAKAKGAPDIDVLNAFVILREGRDSKKPAWWSSSTSPEISYGEFRNFAKSYHLDVDQSILKGTYPVLREFYENWIATSSPAKDSTSEV